MGDKLQTDTCLACGGAGGLTSIHKGEFVFVTCTRCGDVQKKLLDTSKKQAHKFAILTANVVKSISNLITNSVIRLKDSISENIGSVEFLDAAADGDISVVKKYQRQSSSDINVVDSETGFTAIHLAAATNAVDVVNSLMSDSRINVLIRTKDGRLPSSLAFSVAKNDALGDKLIEREAAQRHERNVPFRPEL